LAPRLEILRPGIHDYASAYALQQRVADNIRSGAGPALILLEHPPTYTLGSHGDASNVIIGEERLSALGARIVRADRGGDVTFHGPGQIVGYPILDLRALHIGVSDYVCALETLLIETLSRFGITAGRSPLNRGVWFGDAKIAAIGVRVSRGVTTHGFALNVNTDLSWFDHIVPCGLSGVRMTSMHEVAGTPFNQHEVENTVIEVFLSHFNFDVDEREFAEVAT
jgi:lipoate-protein ligase B